MNPVKAILWGTGDLFGTLRPFYDEAARNGDIEIVGYVSPEEDTYSVYKSFDAESGYSEKLFGQVTCEVAIVSSRDHFLEHMRAARSFGIPRHRIIDGAVFQIPGLDFRKFLDTNRACGVLPAMRISDMTNVNYTREYLNAGNNFRIEIGPKSYIDDVTVYGGGVIYMGKFDSIAWDISFEMGLNGFHNHRNVTTYPPTEHLDWITPESFHRVPDQLPEIRIGSDVWIARGSIVKAANRERPLVIGDGAVIAADSVVVSDVAPYAMVGGNPARVIKYRFEPDVIAALERIRWWDWDIEKIHDSYEYFSDPREFAKRFDTNN